MSNPDSLMVEERLSILVIEGDPEYGSNALEALRGHDVALATSMHEAMDIVLEVGLNQRPQFDLIMSDVHVPVQPGEEPSSIVSTVMSIVYGGDIPVCFVTKADRNGLLDLGDEGYISIVAMDFTKVVETLLHKKGQRSENELFRDLKASAKEKIKADSKTPEVWALALQMIQDCSMKPSRVAGAIKPKRGLDVLFKGLVPKAVPRKQ